MQLSRHERRVLRDLVRRIKSDFGAERVVLFGSAARGDVQADSDVDLLIVLETVDWPTEKAIGRLAFDAGLEIDRVISTMCVSASDLSDGILRASPLVHNIAREGVPL